MKIKCLVVCLFIFYFSLGQNIELQRIVDFMAGNFEWQMIKPISQEVVRTGHRTTQEQFDGHLFFFEETFMDSNIEQVGLFGYDEKVGDIISIGIYNIDFGPHIIRGKPQRVGRGYRVIFYQMDKKIVLEIHDYGHHCWQYFSKKNGIWVQDDLQVDFTRIF
jgi:hypothetical protein